MINHSTLAGALLDAKIDNKPLPEKLVTDLLILTHGGVIKEAGPLAEKAMPNWRADALLSGFTAITVAAPVNLEERPQVVTDAAAPKPVLVTNSGFRFGAASEKEFGGVNPQLVRCSYLALQYSTQDFCCYDGIRSYKEQQQHVADGTSKTMQSKHLQGLAVDLVPWINGQPVWDWDGCYKIALAMDKAATELGIANRITWGGAWDRRLSDFGGSAQAYADEVQKYRARHAGKDFIDGPHYEILP